MKTCFLKLILYTLISTICVTGCAKEGEKTLTMTMSLGEEEWKVLRSDIFPPFEEKHNIKINAYQVESGHLATKLEALQAGKRQEIDLFAQDNMNLSILINKGLVRDLSTYETQLPKEIVPNLVESCKFDDRLMFLPFRPNVQIVYYNQDAFKEHNLSVPRNWDDLLHAAKVFKEKVGTGKLLIKGFGGNATATQVYEFILQAGGDPYAFNDKGCILAFEFLQNLSPYLSPESNRAKWDTTNDILARQEAFIAQNWPFGITILVKRYGLNFIKTYSGWEGPAGEYHVIGGDVFGIPKNSKNVDLAFSFITYIESKEVQEILVSKLGWPSIRHDAYAKVQDWQRPYFESVKKALSVGVFRKQVTWWPTYEKYITEAFREIVFNEAPVEETLDKYRAELQKEKALYN